MAATQSKDMDYEGPEEGNLADVSRNLFADEATLFASTAHVVCAPPKNAPPTWCMVAWCTCHVALLTASRC